MARRSRREFLKSGGAGALAVGLAACAAPPAPSESPPTEPTPRLESALAPTAVAKPAPEGTGRPSAGQRTLVVVQLSGGDDGLNMIVPYGDGLYYQLRPQLAIPADQALPLDGQLGLHPNLK
ncbi:MAG TPA: twin-arginine translocation signal domain-containing protein, partial [Chloroflexota bacterium]|nr:twin-arginine translocation signal domain-containing protein [Chloroflexota bacterium]